jgi:hypothetical protein
MKRNVIIPVLAAALLTGATLSAEAANGRRKAAGVGLAAGIAAGAIGAAILTNQARAQPVPVAPAPGYYPAAQYEAIPTCVIRPVDLFDRAGTYVKTERMRVCR